MNLQEFGQFHVPALEADEIRFNVQIGVLAAAAAKDTPGFRFWTLGGAGHCATQSPGRAILLGNLEPDECCALAQILAGEDYPGVVGVDQTAHWFVEEATARGAKFDEPIPQRLHVLSSSPRSPNAGGSPRESGLADVPLLFEWLTAFRDEAVPQEPPPERARAEELAGAGRSLFWIDNGAPVSVAAISRRLRHTAAIAPVYTPPEYRNKGYAGSVTAAVAGRIFAEGKTSACLYTDLRNPMSNRCYAKIGFRAYCDAWYYDRLKQ